MFSWLIIECNKTIITARPTSSQSESFSLFLSTEIKPFVGLSIFLVMQGRW